MTVIHVLPKRFEDFLRHLDCNSPRRACQGRFDIPAGSMETTIEVHGLKELERALSGVPRRLSDA